MARKKKKENTGHDNIERWLLSYSDFITLLMVFFLLMYSMSSVNAKKFSQLSASLNKTFFGESSRHILGESPGPSLIPGVSETQLEQKNMEASKWQIEEYTKEKHLEDKIHVSITERGLVISLKEVLLFNSGSADLKPEATQVIVEVGQSIENMPNLFRVEGHTDDIPINTAIFPSNWDLSSKREINVLQLIINNTGIDPKKLSATGYGEYKPLVPNNSNLNRALNRRVDVVVLKNELIQDLPKSYTDISAVNENGN